MNVIDGKPILDLVISSGDVAALRAKAALFDWLAAARDRIDIHPVQGGTFSPDHSFFTLWVRQDGKRYCYEAPTLAEAVEKAMEAEGGAQ